MNGSRVDCTLRHSFTDCSIACLFLYISTECTSTDCIADYICTACLLRSLVAVAQQAYKDICIACMTTYRCMCWATDCSIIRCITECGLSDCICLDCLTPVSPGGKHLCAQRISVTQLDKVLAVALIA